MTIVACPWKCGGAINTAIASWCPTCGRDMACTYPLDPKGDEPRFQYGDGNRCDLRTKGPDSWGCHKIKGHATGRGGIHCSTHLDCGYADGGTTCGLAPGHDDGVHECHAINREVGGER